MHTGHVFMLGDHPPQQGRISRIPKMQGIFEMCILERVDSTLVGYYCFAWCMHGMCKGRKTEPLER
jgi:hypothetical protein